MKRILLPIAALGLLACGEVETAFDLEVAQDVVITFGEMPGDVALETTIAYGSLRALPSYVEAEGDLRCAGLDRDASHVELLEMDATAPQVALLYQIDVRTPGAGWVPLAEHIGLVRDRDVVAFGDDAFTVDPEGEALLEEIALSDYPVFDARVTAESHSALRNLIVGMRLGLMLSSDEGRCD